MILPAYFSHSSEFQEVRSIFSSQSVSVDSTLWSLSVSKTQTSSQLLLFTPTWNAYVCLHRCPVKDGRDELFVKLLTFQEKFSQRLQNPLTYHHGNSHLRRLPRPGWTQLHILVSKTRNEKSESS